MHLDIKDIGSGDKVRIEQAGAYIGRPGPAVLVGIDDLRVADKHARIYNDGTVWMLSDLKTEHGTWVHKQKITAPLQLRPGMRFTIADRTFEVLVSPGAPLPPRPAPVPAPVPDPEPELIDPEQETRVNVVMPVAEPEPPKPVETLSETRVLAPKVDEDAVETRQVGLPQDVIDTRQVALQQDAIETKQTALPAPLPVASPPPTEIVSSTQIIAPTPSAPPARENWMQLAPGIASGVFLLAAFITVTILHPVAKPATETPVQALLPASEPASEPVPAPPEPRLSPYESYLKKRDAIEQVIEANPVLLKQVSGLLPAYEKLHAEVSKIDAANKKAKPKKRAKAVEDRLREADLFERTQPLVDDVYEKLPH